jgi:hypothetical protein
MPRDVVLFLVLLAVLLNLALLVGVAIARWRAIGAPARPGRAGADRGSVARAPVRPPDRPALSTMARPAAWSSAGVRVLPGIAVRDRARPIAAPPTQLEPDAHVAGTDGPPAPAMAAIMEAPATTVAPAMTATLDATPPPEVLSEAEAEEAEAAAAADASIAQPAEPATRRGRRFVLPRNDEDKGRTERAIEAFLGEPAPSGSSSTHRPRRRARRHRAPGEGGGPMVLVAALGGFEQLRQTLGREAAFRFAEAYGEALRATLRSGDHVTDLGAGRLRLVVNADEEGAQAMMERARAVCEPWLRLAPVPLALRVRPMPDPRSGNGHRPDGRADRRRPEGSSVEGSPGGEPVRPAGGRPGDGDGRRLAAG